MNREQVKETIFLALNELNIPYRSFEHEPVLDFEKAAEIDERFGLYGVESKSLLIKTKSGRYYIYLTVEAPTAALIPLMEHSGTAIIREF